MSERSDGNAKGRSHTLRTILIQKAVSAALCGATVAGLASCGDTPTETAPPSAEVSETSSETVRTPPDATTVGMEVQRGFLNDNVYHSELGDIHYSSYIPESYDGSEPYALFITLPGWEGLYFQGTGANMVEDFSPEAIQYNDKMIVLSAQLDDWGETSASHVVALTEYFLAHYNIDTEKVYLHGMSGGGETGSLVMGKRPELYAAYLMTSSKWDGDLDVLASARTPVYLAISEKDSYYGADSLKNAYTELHKCYEEQGLTEAEIDRLLVLDVRPTSYFTEHGFLDQHACGQAFAHDESVMGRLFGAHGSRTVPSELEYVPEGCTQPASHPGTLEKLTYRTWESFSYAERSQPLTKTAWGYLPYGYTSERKYDVMYLSHGGWSDETTIMGTPESPYEFKYIMDHAIENGKIRPLIIVLPTYNNTKRLGQRELLAFSTADREFPS